jgi:hypothetical protein
VSQILVHGKRAFEIVAISPPLIAKKKLNILSTITTQLTAKVEYLTLEV